MKGQFGRQNKTRLTFHGSCSVESKSNQKMLCSAKKGWMESQLHWKSFTLSLPMFRQSQQAAFRMHAARCRKSRGGCSSFGSKGESGNISQLCFVWWQLSAAASLEIAARGLVPLVHADSPVAAFSSGSGCWAAAGLMLFLNESPAVVKHLLATLLAVSFLQRAAGKQHSV